MTFFRLVFSDIPMISVIFILSKRKEKIMPVCSDRLTSVCHRIQYNGMSVASRTKMSISRDDNIVWVDMEMTGLDVDKDHILEIACLITDSKLNILAEGPDIVIHQEDNILQNMNSWSIQQHRETGLTESSRNSTINIKAAEDRILEFIKQYAPKGKCPLAGNSVYMDRIFLLKHMPQLNAYLHYRIIDVSTVKELCKRWQPQIYKRMPMKSFKHRALSDIKESIIELQHYKENAFK